MNITKKSTNLAIIIQVRLTCPILLLLISGLEMNWMNFRWKWFACTLYCLILSEGSVVEGTLTPEYVWNLFPDSGDHRPTLLSLLLICRPAKFYMLDSIWQIDNFCVRWVCWAPTLLSASESLSSVLLASHLWMQGMTYSIAPLRPTTTPIIRKEKS